MLNIDPFRVGLFFSIAALISIIAGQVLSRWYPSLNLRNAPGIHNLVVQIAFGIVLFSAVLLVSLLVLPTNTALLTAVSLFSGLLAVRMYVELRRGGKRRSVQERARGVLNGVRANLLGLSLVIASFVGFGALLVYMRWPPAGDIMTLHGPVVAFLVEGGYASVAEHLRFFYPIGFHAFPASFVELLGVYPGEAIFLYGGFIGALILLVMYVLARRLGSTPALSLLAFSAPLLVHPSQNLEKWLLGYFFNGPYPNLLGYLIILLVVLLQVNYLDKSLSSADFKSYLPLALLLASVLLFIYPSFAIIILFHMLLLFTARKITRRNTSSAIASKRIPKKRFLRMAGTLVVLAVIAFAIVLLGSTITSVWQAFVNPPPQITAAYQLDPSFFFDNLTGIVIIIGAAICVRYIVQKRQIGVSSFYLMLIALLFLTLHPVLYSLLWPILPSRAVMILGIIAWPLFVAEITRELKRIYADLKQRKPSLPKTRFPRRRGYRRPEVAILIVLITAQVTSIGMLSPPVTLERLSWFGRTPNFLNDFGAIDWIANNAGPEDLTLTDGSFISRYALSLRPLLLTHHLLSGEQDRDRFEPLDRVWRHPMDVEYVAQTLEAYNVRFILSTSEWGVQRAAEDNAYIPKLYTPSTYARIFEEYPFLKVEYAAGDTRVFRVGDPSFKMVSHVEFMIASASGFWDQIGSWGEGEIGVPVTDTLSTDTIIPSGKNASWRLGHTFQYPVDLAPFNYAKLEIIVPRASQVALGLSLFFYDANGNYTWADMLIARSISQTVFIRIRELENSFGIVDFGRIESIEVVGGLTGPLPSQGDVISIDGIGFYDMQFASSERNS